MCAVGVTVSTYIHLLCGKCSLTLISSPASSTRRSPAFEKSRQRLALRKRIVVYVISVATTVQRRARGHQHSNKRTTAAAEMEKGWKIN